MDLEYLREKGINIDDGISYTGSMEKYLAAVKRYCEGYEQNRAGVKEAYSKKDLKDLMVKVHGLKSNSRMIGAEDMARVFEKLELSAKAPDPEYVLKETPAALMMYGELVDLLKPLTEEEKTEPSRSISREEAIDILEKLIQALDEFDDSLSSELIGKLACYPLSSESEKSLKEASEYIHDFLYEEAREIITELIKNI